MICDLLKNASFKLECMSSINNPLSSKNYIEEVKFMFDKPTTTLDHCQARPYLTQFKEF